MNEITASEALKRLEKWRTKTAQLSSQRAPLVRAAMQAGASKMQIHQASGITRPTIDGILARNPPIV